VRLHLDTDVVVAVDGPAFGAAWLRVVGGRGCAELHN
jgi:hypothetical protein